MTAMALAFLLLLAQAKPVPPAPAATPDSYALSLEQTTQAQADYIGWLQADSAVKEFLLNNAPYQDLLAQRNMASKGVQRDQTTFCAQYGPAYQLINTAGADHKSWACQRTGGQK